MKIIRNEKHEKVRSEFQNKLIRIFPDFTKALQQSNEPDLSDYLEKNIYYKYSMDNFQENLNLLSQHYQKKFKDTGKPEYDIAQFNLLRSNANSFKDFITHHTPKENEPPKGIVIYSNMHSTAAFITHDNKIIAFNLSLSIDAYNVNKIINFTKESSLNTEIHLCQINFGEEENELQKDDVSCTLFAFKSLKLMCQNDYELFHKMEKSPRYNNTYILPPEILRYAQSDKVVERCINAYSEALNLSEDDKQKITQEITGYRSEKYGKFHMLYRSSPRLLEMCYNFVKERI